MVVGGNDGDTLEGEAYANGATWVVGGQEPVVVAASPSKPVACGVEGDTGNQCDIDGTVVGERFTRRFHDVEDTFDEVCLALVGVQYHRFAVDDPIYEDIVVHEFDDLRVFGRVLGGYPAYKKE